MRYANVTGKLSIVVVKFYNHGVVQAVIGIFPVTFAYLIY